LTAPLPYSNFTNATGTWERSLALTKFESVTQTVRQGGDMTKNLLLMTCATSALVLMAGASHAATAAAADIEQRRFWAIKKPKSRVANPGAL